MKKQALLQGLQLQIVALKQNNILRGTCRFRQAKDVVVYLEGIFAGTQYASIYVECYKVSFNSLFLDRFMFSYFVVGSFLNSFIFVCVLMHKNC